MAMLLLLLWHKSVHLENAERFRSPSAPPPPPPPIPLLSVCTKTTTAAPPSLPSPKPLRLKRKKGKKKKKIVTCWFLGPCWNYLSCLYICGWRLWACSCWMLAVSVSNFGGNTLFSAPLHPPQPYHVYNSESAAVISRCTERSALSRGSTCSPCGWRRSAAHPTGGGGVPIPSGSVQRRLRSPGWEQYLSQWGRIAVTGWLHILFYFLIVFFLFFFPKWICHDGNVITFMTWY